MPIEILQKPVSNQILINIVEETEIYDELKKFKIDVSAFKNAGFSHESLKKMLNVLGERKTDEDPRQILIYLWASSWVTCLLYEFLLRTFVSVIR